MRSRGMRGGDAAIDRRTTRFSLMRASWALDEGRRAFSCGAEFGRRISRSLAENSVNSERSSRSEAFLDLEIEGLLAQLEASRLRISRKIAGVERIVRSWRA